MIEVIGFWFFVSIACWILVSAAQVPLAYGLGKYIGSVFDAAHGNKYGGNIIQYTRGKRVLYGHHTTTSAGYVLADKITMYLLFPAKFFISDKDITGKARFSHPLAPVFVSTGVIGVFCWAILIASHWEDASRGLTELEFVPYLLEAISTICAGFAEYLSYPVFIAIVFVSLHKGILFVSKKAVGISAAISKLEEK